MKKSMPERKREDENYFVGIDSPVELRREVLEASKKMVELLKRFEAFRERRDQKAMYIERLKKIVSDLNKMNLKLKTVMPRTNIKLPPALQAMAEKQAKKKASDDEVKQPASELERLEMELGDIENKLAKLRR